MIQDIADPDWMLRPALDWAFRALIAHDLAFDALVLPGHLANLRILIDRYPDLRVVIDHGAKPQIRDGAFEPWASDIARLARETGAFCKCSGLVTEARADWTPADLSPYLDHLLGSFGPERLIFGSDWPVLTLAGDYSGWFDTVNQAIGHWTQQQQAAVLGGNASRFYRLS
jgi:L-fuconolactonase